MKKGLAIVACLLITLLYPEIGCRLANSCCPLFSIGWMYLHHTGQLVLSLLTILALLKSSMQSTRKTWGLSLNIWRWSILTSLKFAAGWLLISVILNLLFSFENQAVYERTFLNVTSDLIFDFIVTPLSEEILFRGLIMGILIQWLPGKLKIGSLSLSYALLLSTLFFSIAHIGINYQELIIENINPMQMAFTVGLGIFYAWMREKTDSLLGPVLAHGFADGSISLIHLLLL